MAGAAAIDPGAARRKRQRNAGAGGYYSRFVGLMRIVLPLTALVVVVSLAIWPKLQEEDERFSIGFQQMSAKEAESLNMVNGQFFGSDEEDRPFSITADLITQFGINGERVDLEAPKADITLDDGTWLVLTANSGRYTEKDRVLDLEGAVNLYHDSGYEIRTPKAIIDLQRGEASSQDPVAGQGPFGTLKAEGFRLLDKGKRIIFTGKSEIVLYPGGQEPPVSQ
ncbi:MAG: LPS export ABC transporter periplasmic protein LptC [Rhodospirillales bacterium]